MRNKFLGTGEPGYHPLRKIRICFSGLKFAVVYDFSVAYKLVVSLFVLALSMVYHQWVVVLLILVSTGTMLALELINSAIEAVCDFMETRENEKIRIIKDIAAAATGISIFIWVCVLIVEISRLNQLWRI